jgi:hypothetical protein
MPKGERVLAQSKRTAPPPISTVFKIQFSIGIFQIGIPLEIISQLVSIFQIDIYLKTLLKAKRRISFRGSFV